jgi:hypothetical protein
MVYELKILYPGIENYSKFEKVIQSLGLTYEQVSALLYDPYVTIGPETLAAINKHSTQNGYAFLPAKPPHYK